MRALAAVVFGLLGVAMAGPAAAQAVTEDFETPALADGTKVNTQFEGNGVYFTERPGDGIYLPEIDLDAAKARSGSRMLDITTGPPTEEFQRPGMEGRFTTVVEDVTVYVRNLYTPATANLTLRAFREGGGTVTDTDTAVAAAEGWVKLEVDAGVGNSFFRFEVVGGLSDAAKEIRVDDLEFTVDAAAAPNYTISTEEVGGVALPGEPKEYKIQIQRLNGHSESVAFSGNVFSTFGELVSFSPDPTTGSSTTVTMTLPADATEGEKTLTITSSTASLPNQTLEIDFVVESPFRIEAVDPLPVRADRCTTTPAAFRVVRNRFFSDPINVSVAHQSGSIPSEIGASVSPATILSLETVNPVMLNVTRSDDPDSSAAIPLKLVASSDGVERTVLFDLVRAAPRLTSVVPSTLFAPRALLGGTGLTVRGNGLCPGAEVQFGNEAARAPGAFAPAPTATDPTKVQLTATTPRLATTGPVSVVNPSGAVASSAGILPDTTVHSYRDRLGFNFPNENSVRRKNDAGEFTEPPPVGAGSLRDWQELLGPRQTNLNGCEVGLFLPGCWEVITPIPTPQHGLMQTILGEASYYNRGGTCVGFAISSRRIAMGQATVRDRLTGAAGFPVWSLQRTGRETIPGRGDIPLEGRASYSPIKYAAIQHPAQTTAEYIRLWVERRTINAVSGPDIMRRALENHLRAGRRPLLNINWDGGGHAVNVYDIENRPGGGYFIRVYDNNYPYWTGEERDGAARKDRDERLSRIEVTPGGSWKAPGLPVTVGEDAAGNPIREPREGPTGDLSWIAVENELPVVPSPSPLSTGCGHLRPRASARRSPPPRAPPARRRAACLTSATSMARARS